MGRNPGASSAIRRVLSTVTGLIAATALRHGLHIMTRYPTRFAATGVLIVDPWKQFESGNPAG